MKARKKFKPYIRRGKGNERTHSFQTAMQLSFYSLFRDKYYVLVQRGFPNTALAVGRSKREIKQSILAVYCGRYSFEEWAREIKFRAYHDESFVDK